MPVSLVGSDMCMRDRWEGTRLRIAPYRMYIFEEQRHRTALSRMYVWEGTRLWAVPYRMYIREGQRLRTALSSM